MGTGGHCGGQRGQWSLRVRRGAQAGEWREEGPLWQVVLSRGAQGIC